MTKSPSESKLTFERRLCRADGRCSSHHHLETRIEPFVLSAIFFLPKHCLAAPVDFKYQGITTGGSPGARYSSTSQRTVTCSTTPGAVLTRLTISNSKHLDGHTWQPGNGYL